MRKIMMAAALALGTTSIAAPASAQLVGGGLVAVNISDIAVDIADVLDVNVQDVLNIGNVQVPIGIAANVCPNVGANVLAQAAQRGDATCTATNTTNAIAKAVQKKMNSNKQ